MPEFAGALPSERLASGMLSLSKPERDIVTKRFFRDPPVLLDSIARDKKISYHGALTTVYRALHTIADGLGIKARIKTRPPIRRPMREPSAPRQLPWRRPGPEDFQYGRVLDEIQLWPWLDGLYQTVYAHIPGAHDPEDFFDRDKSDLVLNDI